MTVMFTAPPGGTAAFSCADARDSAAARAEQAQGQVAAPGRDRKLRFMGLGPPCRWPPPALQGRPARDVVLGFRIVRSEAQGQSVASMNWFCRVPLSNAGTVQLR